MKAFLTLTPESNVDHKTNSIINKHNKSYRLVDCGDAITIQKRWGRFDSREGIKVSSISLYDHSIIIKGIAHCILYMQSKKSFDDNPNLLALAGLKPETMVCTKCHGSVDKAYNRENHSSIFQVGICGRCGGSGRIPYQD